MEEEVLQRLFYVSSTKHTIIALEKHVLSSKKGSEYSACPLEEAKRKPCVYADKKFSKAIWKRDGFELNQSVFCGI